jgi:hypothetical protein
MLRSEYCGANIKGQVKCLFVKKSIPVGAITGETNTLTVSRHNMFATRTGRIFVPLAGAYSGTGYAWRYRLTVKGL